MGKKRVTQLLEQLKVNQQAELQNAAAIYTVAQVAVNELQNQLNPIHLEPGGLKPETVTPALSAAPVLLNKAELLRRHGSYNGCRQAAKQRGIKFSKNPSWQQLTTAFSYIESCQRVVQTYLEQYPSADLKGVTIELKLG